MTLARLLFMLSAAGLAFGLLYRLWPLTAGPEALAQFFITEDGYLMLTVARNLAIGNGLSVSDGTIATNGVQPLATLFYAVPYWLTSGDKTESLAGIILIMTAFSVAAAVAIRAFARAVLSPFSQDGVWPLLVTALWFLGPLALLHSMNGLETGLYTFMVALTVTYFGHVTMRGGRYTLREQLIFGALCGVTFLSRNDGAFLVVALFLVRFLHVQVSGQLKFREAVAEALPPGILSLVIAAPWLIHNEVYFGSIVPISGTAQSMAAEVGQNLPLVPIKLFETMFPMLPVPSTMERSVVLGATGLAALVVVLAWFAWRVFARPHPFRVAIAGYLLYAAMIVGYYGLFFGAEHFLSRYFQPLAPLFITAAVAVGLDLAEMSPWRGRDLARIGGGVAVTLSLVLLVRLVLPGVKEQGHFHVVDWVEQNVPEETWVGAVQTGTLGYWHDRTINLDGKVNPAALEARRTEGNVLGYVVDSPIEYVTDWYGMTGWVDVPNERFRSSFEVLVGDRKNNLAVLRRRADVPRS